MSYSLEEILETIRAADAPIVWPPPSEDALLVPRWRSELSSSAVSLSTQTQTTQSASATSLTGRPSKSQNAAKKRSHAKKSASAASAPAKPDLRRKVLEKLARKMFDQQNAAPAAASPVASMFAPHSALAPPTLAPHSVVAPPVTVSFDYNNLSPERALVFLEETFTHIVSESIHEPTHIYMHVAVLKQYALEIAAQRLPVSLDDWSVVAQDALSVFRK